MALRARKPVEPPGRSLWSRMTVRHRAPGHLRFDLPAALCSEEAAGILESGLSRLDGVTRVVVFAGSRKLSIRWIEELCPLAEVVRTLAAVVDGIGAPPPAHPAVAGLAERVRRLPLVARWRTRWAGVKAGAGMLSQIVAIKTGRKPPLPAEARDWAIAFANDLVVFYLVRLHWQRITKQWLPNPWTYRAQWLAVVYLTFLLVRHRKTRKTQAEAELPPPCCGGA